MQKQIKSSASHAHVCQDGGCLFMTCNSRWAWTAHGVFTSWTKVFFWLLLWLLTAPPSRWNPDKWASLFSRLIYLLLLDECFRGDSRENRTGSSGPYRVTDAALHVLWEKATIVHGDVPVKNSPNSCSSFMALSKVFLACSSVSLLFMSLHTRAQFSHRRIQWSALCSMCTGRGGAHIKESMVLGFIRMAMG